MISDTVCEAIQDIERHQKAMPEGYETVRDVLDAMKAVMRGLGRLPKVVPPESLVKYVKQLEASLGHKIVIKECHSRAAILEIINVAIGLACLGDDGEWISALAKKR